MLDPSEPELNQRILRLYRLVWGSLSIGSLIQRLLRNG